MTSRIAVLGAGRIGQVHARAVAASNVAQLTAVADAMPAAAEALSSTYGCRIGEVDELIQADDIDAVIICTPTDTHANLIEDAARAGKAIFCEKPIDLDAARVRACLDVVAQTGARLMVGFNRRFDPHFAALKSAIDAGEIGEVEQVVITSRDPAAPPLEYIRRSGGLFRDMMIHDFDIARWMLGEEPVALSAFGSVLTDPDIAGEDVDTATATLLTASGKQCVITNSRRATYGYDQRVEVHGSTGMLRISNPRNTLVERAGASGYAREPLQDFFMTRYVDAYDAELTQFVAWVAGEDVDVPSGDDGLRALLLADAAAASVTTGTTQNLEFS